MLVNLLISFTDGAVLFG